MGWNEGHRDLFTVQGNVYKEEAGESVQAVTYAPLFSRIVERPRCRAETSWAAGSGP